MPSIYFGKFSFAKKTIMISIEKAGQLDVKELDIITIMKRLHYIKAQIDIT